MKKKVLSTLLTGILVGSISIATFACTSILVTPGASVDGIASVTHTADCGSCQFDMKLNPAMAYEAGTTVEVPYIPQGGLYGMTASTEPTGNFIPQADETYKYISVLFGYMNEKQVALGETTIGGRRDFYNSQGIFDITNLSMLCLERGATAREAIQVMGDLAVKYGYKDGGEELSVADPNEVWMFEIVGPGPLWSPGDEEPGAFWVARRVPDGHISVSANSTIIGEVDFNDTENYMFGPGIREYAIEQGWWNPDSGETFNWSTHFNAGARPAYSYRRVCRIYSQVAPSLNGTYTEENPPFSVPVDEKISFQQLIDLHRDHYEGTEFDQSNSLTAGPWNNPRRYQGWNYKVDGVSYSWNRTISAMQCEYFTVTQSRKDLPDAIGGVVWYGPASPATTTLVPIYVGVNAISPNLTEEKAGSQMVYTEDSYWWAIQFLNTIVDLKWSVIYPEIQAFQEKYEKSLVRMQPAIDSAALKLYNQDPGLAAEFLTNFCANNVETVTKAAQDLLTQIMIHNKAGMTVDQEAGKAKSGGYPQAWLDKIFTIEEAVR